MKSAPRRAPCHAGAAGKGELRQHLAIDWQRLGTLQSQPTYAEIADSGLDFSDLRDPCHYRNIDWNSSRPSAVLQHSTVRSPHASPGLLRIGRLVNHEVSAHEKCVGFCMPIDHGNDNGIAIRR